MFPGSCGGFFRNYQSLLSSLLPSLQSSPPSSSSPSPTSSPLSSLFSLPSFLSLPSSPPPTSSPLPPSSDPPSSAPPLSSLPYHNPFEKEGGHRRHRRCQRRPRRDRRRLEARAWFPTVVEASMEGHCRRRPCWPDVGTMFYACDVRLFLRGKPLGQIRNFAEIPGLRTMSPCPSRDPAPPLTRGQVGTYRRIVGMHDGLRCGNGHRAHIREHMMRGS